MPVVNSFPALYWTGITSGGGGGGATFAFPKIIVFSLS